MLLLQVVDGGSFWTENVSEDPALRIWGCPEKARGQATQKGQVTYGSRKTGGRVRLPGSEHAGPREPDRCHKAALANVGRLFCAPLSATPPGKLYPPLCSGVSFMVSRGFP